jgi:hypothetical protein
MTMWNLRWQASPAANESEAGGARLTKDKPESGGDEGVAKRPSFRGAFMDMEVRVITLQGMQLPIRAGKRHLSHLPSMLLRLLLDAGCATVLHGKVVAHSQRLLACAASGARAASTVKALLDAWCGCWHRLR